MKVHVMFPNVLEAVIPPMSLFTLTAVRALEVI